MKKLHTKVDKPWQEVNLQCLTSEKAPVQLRAVEPRGSGELQNRYLDLTPLPHDLEHGVNCDHWPNPPST